MKGPIDEISVTKAGCSWPRSKKTAKCCFGRADPREDTRKIAQQRAAHNAWRATARHLVQGLAVVGPSQQYRLVQFDLDAPIGKLSPTVPNKVCWHSCARRGTSHHCVGDHRFIARRPVGGPGWHAGPVAVIFWGGGGGLLVDGRSDGRSRRRGQDFCSRCQNVTRRAIAENHRWHGARVAAKRG